MTQPSHNLGSCCVCGGKVRVNLVIQLPVRTPVPGKGWGCLQCGLPPDGAVAVACQACSDRHGPGIGDHLKAIVSGFPSEDLRRPFDPKAVPPAEKFDHDLRLHPETWKCRECDCTQDNPCVAELGDGETAPCFWIARDLCNGCATAEQMRDFIREHEVRKREDLRKHLLWLAGRHAGAIIIIP